MRQHNLLIDHAKSAGIQVEEVPSLDGAQIAILRKGDVSELIVDGVPASWVGWNSILYCDNKQLTKTIFKEVELPHASSIAFSDPISPLVHNFIKAGNSYVCKPMVGTNGDGVRLNVRSVSDVKQYFQNFKGLSEWFILEEFVAGKDLRIQVIGGKICAACIREPANVIGDGTSTLQELIQIRRSIMLQQNPVNKLDIDEVGLQLLKDQKLSFEDVPEKGRKVQLKLVSNMGQGGVAYDITGDISPQFQEWVTILSKQLKSGYFGLDLLTTNYKNEIRKTTKIIEINARADWLHHTFSEGRTHDIPGIIMTELFSGKSPYSNIN